MPFVVCPSAKRILKHPLNKHGENPVSNEDNKPNYDGDRTTILPGNLPALKPIPIKEPAQRSPQIPSSEMSMDAVIGLQKSSRRIAVVKAIDILLRYNNGDDMLDHFELALAKANEKLNGKA